MPRGLMVDIASLDPIQRMELADRLYDSAIAEIEQQLPSLTPIQIENLDHAIASAIASV